MSSSVDEKAKKLGSHPSSASGSVPRKRSPEESANIFSQLSFWWLNGIITLGAKKPLEDSDMWELIPKMDAAKNANMFADAWEKEKEKKKKIETDFKSKFGDVAPGTKVVTDSEGKKHKVPSFKPSLISTLNSIYGFHFWLSAFFKMCMDGLSFFQPIILEWLLTFIYERQYLADADKPAAWKGYLYALGLGLNPFFSTICTQIYFRLCMVVGMQARTALVTNLYTKSLKLSPKARAHMSTGQIVNMMSTDASKIDLVAGYFHYLWSAVAQIAVAIGLLVRALGPSALAGVGVVFLLVPIQGRVMRKLQAIRKSQVLFTDSRVKLMNEILQGIRVIKVYAWENSFFRKLSALRTQEMSLIRRGAYIRAINSIIMQISPVLMSLITFVVLANVTDTFKPQYIFSSLVLFNLLRFPLMMFPMSVGFLAEALISVARIEKFLMAEELSSKPELVDSKEFAVKVDNATFEWEVAPAAIEDANPNKKKGPPGAAAAPAGRPAAGGPPATTGAAPAASAAPAAPAAAPVELFSLENINFSVPVGSLTVIVGAVGSGKSSLLAGVLGEMRRKSGSVQISGTLGFCPQQAWIQNSTLKENILFGLPYDEKKYRDAIKYAALERDIEILPAHDLTEIGEKGINLSGGQKQRVSLARAIYFDSDIVLLDDPLSAVDAHVSKYLFNECILHKMRGKTRVLVTHQLQYVSSCDHVLFLQNGRITEAGTYSQLMENKKDFATLMTTYVGKEKDQDESHEGEGNDKKLSKRKSSAADKGESSKSTKSKEELDKEKAAAKHLMSSEERVRGGVPLTTYIYYLGMLGGSGAVLFCFLFMCLQQADSNITNQWLSWWSDYKYGTRSVGFYLGIYAGLSLGQMIFSLINTLATARIGVDAAVRLHDISFARVLRSPMSFFDTTPLGRIISRFSKDQDVIDSLLMDTLRMIIFMLLSLLGTFIMIAVVVPWFLLALFPIMFVYYFTQDYYRKTSREIKRVESISRSPLYAHFSETLTGLGTIRAYRQEAQFIAVNQSRMNDNNRPYYTQTLSQRWLSIRLESLGSLIIFCAAIIIAAQSDSIQPGNAGLAMSYAIGCTGILNWMVRQLVEAENAMNSVERCKFYSDSIDEEAPAEKEEDKKLVKGSWPTRGDIEFKDVKMRYRQGLPLVLHGISAFIRGGSRVAVVGRTGAGKSSLMLALFRLVEAAEGKIFIDGVDISTLGLSKLRSNLAIIPQDPVLYSGTVRSNLDPFGEHTDDKLWLILEKSFLADAIRRLEGGLDAPVVENGENFSVGQRCQICLARAMLVNAKVLIMDEATASVDMETDAFIQNSLRNYFKDCTILTIAHRLNTIVDYDKVMVLDFGKIVEFASPAQLLRDPNGIFNSMVNETGEVNSALLRGIAFAKERGEVFDIARVLTQDGTTPDGAAPVPQNVNGHLASSGTYASIPDADMGPEVSMSHVTFHDINLDDE